MIASLYNCKEIKSGGFIYLVKKSTPKKGDSFFCDKMVLREAQFDFLFAHNVVCFTNHKRLNDAGVPSLPEKADFTIMAGQKMAFNEETLQMLPENPIAKDYTNKEFFEQWSNTDAAGLPSDEKQGSGISIEEFDEMGFSAGMRCLYRGKEYDMVSVDFEERLIGIEEFPNDEDAPLSWKRCENCQIVKPQL